MFVQFWVIGFQVYKLLSAHLLIQVVVDTTISSPIVDKLKLRKHKVRQSKHFLLNFVTQYTASIMMCNVRQLQAEKETLILQPS